MTRVRVAAVGLGWVSLHRHLPALRRDPSFELVGVIDRHPGHDNAWLVGGGSGHGFKHGPALGEYVAARVQDGAAVEERFSLATKATVQKRGVY